MQIATSPISTRSRRWMLALLAPLGVAALAAPVSAQAAGEPLDERESYAFVRTAEGEATVLAAGQGGQGAGEILERNQPLLTGDALSTDGRSRLEILLPDRNRLVVDRNSVVRLERLAYSGDRDSRETVLRLERGELLLEVTEEALGDELPRIEAEGGTVYVQEPGVYRVFTDAGGWLQVVVRDGYAELVTDRGSTVVRAGESAETGFDSWGRVEISAASGNDALERWGEQLTARARRGGSSSRYVDSSLAYASSDLDDNGDWVVVQNVNYWRPRVTVGWRPYYDGRWAWTPSGYTWVSNESWGWVPYHYGRWCLVHGYGWVWRPGPVYSPAWVYWHWSNGYAGWCPTGYYTNYYSPWYGGGWRHGLYGWAGGSWGHYSHWNFAPTHCFKDRRFRGHVRSGHDLEREQRWPEVPRGLVTTDTRDFRPDRIDRPDQLLHRIRDRELATTRGELPDVSDFVGRRRELPPEVANVIREDRPGKPQLRLDEPKVAETPGWREAVRGGGGGTDSGKVIYGGRRSAPEQPQVSHDPGVLRSGAAARVPTADRQVRTGTPRVDSPKTELPPVDQGSRQGWKERSPDERGSSGSDSSRGNAGSAGSNGSNGTKGSAPTVSSGRTAVPRAQPKDDPTYDAPSRNAPPVERVVSGTRRGAPQSEPGDGGGSARVRSYPPGSDGASSGNRSKSDGSDSSKSWESRGAAPQVQRTPPPSSPPPSASRQSEPRQRPTTSTPPTSSGGGSSKGSSPQAGSSSRQSSGGSTKSTGSQSGSRSGSSSSSKKSNDDDRNRG